MGAFSYTTGPCRVCGKTLTAAGFARVAHEDMHVRSGELVYVWKWTWKGEKLSNRLLLPKQVKAAEADGYFKTFEDCKTAYEWSSTEALASRDLNP